VISYSPAILPVLVEYQKYGGFGELKLLAEKIKSRDMTRIFRHEVSKHVLELYQKAFREDVPKIVDLTGMTKTELNEFAMESESKRAGYRNSGVLGRLG